MNFKEILKKYWFICLVALGLLVFFVAYAVQSYQNRPVYVEAKNDAEGRSIVYTLNGEDLLADDLYDRLYKRYPPMPATTQTIWLTIMTEQLSIHL